MAQKTKCPPVPEKSEKPKKRGPQSAQQTIPYKEMLKDGICKVREGYYTKKRPHYRGRPNGRIRPVSPAAWRGGHRNIAKQPPSHQPNGLKTELNRRG